MLIRLGMVVLAAGLFLGGAAKAELGAFAVDGVLDARGSETTAPIATDLSDPAEVAGSQAAALDPAEPAGEADAGAAPTAALDRAEPDESEESEVAVVLPPVADQLSADLVPAVATDSDVSSTRNLDEVTGSAIAGATGTEAAAAADGAVVASVALEAPAPAPVEPSLVPSEPTEAPAESGEPSAGP
jgi:hypothetical protein